MTLPLQHRQLKIYDDFTFVVVIRRENERKLKNAWFTLVVFKGLSLD